MPHITRPLQTDQPTNAILVERNCRAKLLVKRYCMMRQPFAFSLPLWTMEQLQSSFSMSQTRIDHFHIATKESAGTPMGSSSSSHMPTVAVPVQTTVFCFFSFMTSYWVPMSKPLLWYIGTISSKQFCLHSDIIAHQSSSLSTRK